MPGRASLLFLLLCSTAGSTLAQPASERSPLDLGKAAMDAHDPTAAIAHFEQTDSKEGRGWLAAALMMESRSPSDRYVERAFDAATRARADQLDRVRSRAELAAALRPGEMVIVFLVGERHAYAWAFDRHTLLGYPLPPSAEIATAVERVNAYVAQKDRGGVQRIADDLMPALLGPILDRLPALTRLIFVMDGPLRQLSIGEMPAGEGARPLAQRLAVSTVDDASLFDEIGRAPSPPQPAGSPTTLLVAAAIVMGILLVAGVAAVRRRSSIAQRDADRAGRLDQI
jgi:hypothetical protein